MLYPKFNEITYINQDIKSGRKTATLKPFPKYNSKIAQTRKTIHVNTYKYN